MKKTLLLLLHLFLLTLLFGCKNTTNENEIIVGVSFEPVKTILNLIKDDLEADGFTLTIKEFGLAANNLALKDNEIDANLIQHQFFLNSFNEANQSDLKIVFNLYHATYSLYSSEITTLNDLDDNTLITLPDDESNKTRAFYLLDQAGLITLNDKTKHKITEEDIISNEKNLQFEYIALDGIAQRYKETKYAVMYPTYARALNLEGDEQRLYVELTDEITKGYAISLAVRANDQNNPKIKALILHLQSEKVRNYLLEEYGWASMPAF